ncbi:MAG: hypothetical protein IKR09_03005 [Alphaproteobacteria bacterium]|nr:hypothetical protein [Alphaproteobacteria bacterium]
MVVPNTFSANELLERFNIRPTLKAIPNDLKRIIIPVFGFSGATSCKYEDRNGKIKTGTGITFFNPKDNSLQFLKQKDGCLILYDNPKRRVKVSRYLKKHPNALQTAENIQKFIRYIKENVVTDSESADLWTTDTTFVSKLKNAPEKEEIKSGKTVVLEKKQTPVEALYVSENTSIQGPAASPQIAGKGGAYIIKEATKQPYFHMIQKKEFKKAYKIIQKIKPEKNNGI